jgi:N6-adenosine-specific RNA methylase IME4
MTFDGLPQGHFRAILADPPWRFRTWSDTNQNRAASRYYGLMTAEDIAELPVDTLAADNCVLFMWAVWSNLRDAMAVIEAWGFEYKTCAFCWTKAHIQQLEMFREDIDSQMGMGYWTRASTEPCLLATRGNPKRLNADVHQAIIEPRREHSRKPDCVHNRIERLVYGPYLELFARKTRPGWVSWGNEVNKFDPIDDFSRSLDDAYEAIRERVKGGGPGWEPK